MKRALQFLGWAALIALLHTVLFRSPWGEAIEGRVMDLWFHLRGPIAAPPEIVIVAMDEDSYDALGFSSSTAWPRAAHATLLNRLATNGARRVVMDILFAKEGAPAADDELVAVMRRLPVTIGAELIDVKDGAYDRARLILPAPKFRDAAAVALVGLPQDERELRRFLVPDALASREVTRGLTSLALAASGAPGQPGPRDLVRLYGPARTIRTYSYYQALQTDPPLPPDIFRDKIVFIGLSLQTGVGPLQKDEYVTSFGPMYGVEVHATAAANLLEGKWIRRKSATSEALALGILTVLLTLLLLNVRPVWGAACLLGYVAAWALLAFSSFDRGLFLPGATLGIVVLPITYLGATLSNYLVVRLKELRLERAFKFYLSPEMAREVAKNPQALQLGGEEVECTAMFTDIAGFTSVAERMKPAEVSRMLNAYFTEVMDSVFDNRGTVIQFIGDGVYALWGAPAKTSEHARLCCTAALAIHAEIDRFNQTGRFPPLKTRFGINTGPVLVGNLGSKRRFDFTGIGDTVNLASRLEGLNKYFGTTILLTDSTRVQLPPDILTLKLGLIRAVGKSQPVGLHTLFRPASETTASQWTDACSRFLARDWQIASDLFAAVAQAEPHLAKSASLYAQQIALHRQSSPPSDWQGEIIFTSK